MLPAPRGCETAAHACKIQRCDSLNDSVIMHIHTRTHKSSGHEKKCLVSGLRLDDLIAHHASRTAVELVPCMLVHVHDISPEPGPCRSLLESPSAQNHS